MGGRHVLIGEVTTFENSYYVDSSDASNWKTGQTTEGLINQQVNTYEDYLVLDFTPTITGLYEIDSMFNWSHNTTSDNFRANLEISGGFTEDIKIVDFESREIGGTGVVLNSIVSGNIIGNVDSGTDVRNTSTEKIFRTLDSGENYIVKIKWNTQTGNDEGAIYSGNIKVKLFKI